MPVIKVKDNEPFELAMKRFKKQVEKAGILTELAAASTSTSRACAARRRRRRRASGR